MADHLNLVPPLVAVDRSNELVASGRILSAVFSPRDDSLAIHARPLQTPTRNHVPNGITPDVECHVYLARPAKTPSSERRLFITDTSIIFAAFQNLVNTARADAENTNTSKQYNAMIRKLTFDYLNFTKECWVHASQPITRPDGPLQFSSDHYRSLYTSFSLFQTLYLPDYEFEEVEDAPIGEELMEWLNIHFIEPSTEEGDQLSGQDRPWEDENFWPYLTRTTLRGLTKASIFFLNVLAQHPSEHLQQLAVRLAPLLESQPRPQTFEQERDFVRAWRRWQDAVKTLRIELDRVPEDVRHDGFENWWDRASDIVALLEGRGEVVKRICLELGADWKEVCAAWGIFVDPRLRRHGLPDVVSTLLDEMPADPTNPEDLIHASLFLGKPDDALRHAARLDPWLAAHMADIMAAIGLLKARVDESGLSLRDQYVLAFADYLRSDAALWRITVDYMCSCSEVGKERADEVLIRVPLNLEAKTRPVDATRPEDPDVREGNVVGVLQEINATCFQHQREQARRSVCRIAAQFFVREKQYGLAVSYATSAEDWPGLARIVDRVLAEYITKGPVRFAQLVADIAPSLQQLEVQSGPGGIFIHRLVFAVRYAEFHQRRLNNDIQGAALDLIALFTQDLVPKSWWAVVLCDSVDFLQYRGMLLFSSAEVCDLMRKLEEIYIRSNQGGEDDYLHIIGQTLPGGTKAALQRLKTVRLALAEYFARCALVGVGGKDEYHLVSTIGPFQGTGVAA